MASRPDDLYERDFYAWTREQAAALRHLARTRPNVPVDWPHLIEEVRDLGTSQRNACRSHLRTIIEHCLKIEVSPAVEPRTGWCETVERVRNDLDDVLTPTLRRHLREHLSKLYGQARRPTVASLDRSGERKAAEALPETCPYRFADLLNHDWLPESRHGLTP